MPEPANESPALVDRIDACLPQTQCTLCGYPRCRAYAEALAHGAAEINQCPPGGDVTIRMLNLLLQRPVLPPDPRFGMRQPRTRAVIDESLCIGCRKCLDACPVDAIVGARKLMHTVIATECTGCGLCLPPCPVDCIALVPVAPMAGDAWPEYMRAETAHWRLRTERRLARLARGRRSRRITGTVLPHDREKIRADIRAAIERVKAKKAK